MRNYSLKTASFQRLSDSTNSTQNYATTHRPLHEHDLELRTNYAILRKCVIPRVNGIVEIPTFPDSDYAHYADYALMSMEGASMLNLMIEPLLTGIAYIAIVYIPVAITTLFDRKGRHENSRKN